MTTDEVLSRLVLDLKPVAPLPTSGVRTSRWVVGASAVAGLAVALLGRRVDLVSAAGTLAFQAHSTLVAVATVTSAGAALVLAVPGEQLAPWRLWAPIAAVAAWAVWLSAELGLAAAASSTAWTVDAGWGCVAKSIAVGLVPATALLVMIRRGAILDPGRALTLAALASAGIGALGVEFMCPKTEPMHHMVWHLEPVIALPAAICLASASRCAKWLRRRDAHAWRP